MELKSTSLGKHLAQHPYNRVRLLNAGVEVSGDKHQYLIPFNQLLSIDCKRGLVWGELEFELPAGKVVRLHGTEWQETQAFYRHLLKSWLDWSEEMSLISAEVLQRQTDSIQTLTQQDKWFSRQTLATLQNAIRDSLGALPLPVSRLEAFDNCRDHYQHCLRWLEQGDETRTAVNQAWMDRTLAAEQPFFETVESSPLNVSQSKAVINGELSTVSKKGCSAASVRSIHA